MRKEDPIQRCPFCGQTWGQCEHHRVLTDWEEAARTDERSKRRRLTAVEETEPTEHPSSGALS